ncbi:MAG: alpha/beta hydrolase [Cyanobacteria bacterium J06632_3]
MLTAKIKGISHAYELTDALTASESVLETDAVVNTDVKTLVFIHGWLLSRAYWRPLVAQLSSRYRCLTYDLRGFGDSAHVPSDYAPVPRQIPLPPGHNFPGEYDRSTEMYEASAFSLAAYAQDLSALLDHLGIEKAWLLGHSLGGSIALWAAYLLPERIQGVICINAGGGIYIPEEFEKFRSAGQQMVKFRPSWLPQLPILPRIFSRVMVKNPLAVDWGKQRLQDFVRANGQAATGSLLETTTEDDVHLLPQVMRQIKQPVYFITATEDTVMPPRYVRYLASFHPQFCESSSVFELADCGHMAMIEQPGAVGEIVRTVVGYLPSRGCANDSAQPAEMGDGE